MAQRSIQPDLARERTKASFDTENLTNFLYGGKEKVKRKRHLGLHGLGYDNFTLDFPRS